MELIENGSAARTRVLRILKIISLLPLAVYPFVLMANVMSFTAPHTGLESVPLLVSCYSFLVFSSLYPLTLIYSLKYNHNKRAFIAILPLFHLAISVVLCIIWNRLDGISNMPDL